MREWEIDKNTVTTSFIPYHLSFLVLHVVIVSDRIIE